MSNPFTILLKVLVTAIQQEWEIKGMHIGKEEVKLSQFSKDMILYIEIPKEATKKVLELMNSTRLKDTKISIQKYIVFLFTKQ